MENIKTVIINRVIEKIEIQIKNAERGLIGAIEESKAHKGAMASRYDTFKEEAQYLAGGHNAQRIKLNKVLTVLKSLRDSPPKISKGSGYAIFEVKNLDDELRVKYFLLPAGGGDTYEVGGEEITILNAGASMARAFIGTVAGDEVEVKIKDMTRRFCIISIT